MKINFDFYNRLLSCIMRRMLQRFQIKFFLVKKKSILESKKDSDYNLLDATKLTF